MKEIIIPIEKENSLNIAEIDEDFKGVIIAYKDKKPIGIFRYDCDLEYPWYLSNIINTERSLLWNTEGDSFYESVMNGIKNKVFDSLKAIEFE